MTNLQSFEASRGVIVELFRRALVRKLNTWNLIRTIEHIVGDMEGVDDLLDSFAAGLDGPHSVSLVAEKTILDELRGLLVDPDGEHKEQALEDF